MYFGVLQIEIFEPEDFREDLAEIVRAHACINLRRITRAHDAGRPYLTLYESGARWHRVRPFVASDCDGDICHAPEESDRWQTIDGVYSTGGGDCKDLVAIRLAELWLSGEHDADVGTEVYPGALGDNYDMYHVVVVRADGSIEDPSRELGMEEVA